MELRCEAAGVRCQRIETKLRLANPQDEQAKKHEATLAELNALKNRRPDLNLMAVSAGLNPIGVTCFEERLPKALPPLDVEREVETQKRQHPKYKVRSSHPSLGGTNLLASMVPEEQVRQYDERLEAYYEKFAEYVRACNDWLQRRARTFAFDLWLGNTGTAPGSDIEVEFRFPPRIVNVAEMDSYEATDLREPMPPIPPKLPSPFQGPLVFSDHLSAMQMPDLGRIGSGEREDQVYVYNNGDRGFGIHAACTRLKHHKLRKIGTFLTEFESFEKAGPFESGYTITASESPKPIEGKAVFKVQVENSARE